MSERQLVTAVLLTADRPEMTREAISCFVQQDYPKKYRRLYVLDSGQTPCIDALPFRYPEKNITYHRAQPAGKTIGELRNYANSYAVEAGAEVLMHWDSDDWYGCSHITAMAARLRGQQPGIAAVGYRTAMFYHRGTGDVWAYKNESERYCLGASLCYWAGAWRAFPFPATSKGEDSQWLRSIPSLGFEGHEYAHTTFIATLHDGNTSSHEAFNQRGLPGNHNHWTRLADNDASVSVLLGAR